VVVNNVHTSKVANNQFPSTILIHNYYNVPITYAMTVFNAGGRTSGTGLVLQSDSGKQTCQVSGNTVNANDSKSIPFSSIEATNGCTIDSDESYANVVITPTTAGQQPDAVITHTIAAGTFSGNNLNMSPVCAVNPVSTSTTTGGDVPTSPYL
jgi:hypothetical protein